MLRKPGQDRIKVKGPKCVLCVCAGTFGLHFVILCAYKNRPFN